MAKGELIYNGRDGYSYKRNNHLYDLLEGMSLNGTTSSDICFVIELDEDGCYKDLKTWFCLGIKGSNNYPQELLKICDEVIDDTPTDEEIITDLKEERKELNEKIRDMEKEINELRAALLIATRNSGNATTGGIKLKRKTFYDLYNCGVGDELMDDIYGYDVYVNWHGMYCNCGDGATAANNIIEGIRDCLEEDDNDNY